ARKRTRSRSGLAGSCASSSTRRKKSRRLSSRSMNSRGSLRSGAWSAISGASVPGERDVEAEHFAEQVVLLLQRPLLEENVVGAARPYLHLRPPADHQDPLDLL